MAFATLERTAVNERQGAILRVVRRVLDTVYDWAGYLAAASMVMILVITVAQIVTRYANINIRGLSDYAGYFMAASAFLAFPMALNRGSHVRIELLLGLMGRYRFFGEVVAFGLSAMIAAWFAYYSCTMVYWSWKFGDLSTGLDATPLWIPQCTMAIGAVLFAVSIFDQFMRLLWTGAHAITPAASIE